MSVVHNSSRTGQIVAAVGLVAVILLFNGFMMAPDSDLLLKISKSIDIFGRVYKEVTTSYVDEIDPERFMEAGIEGMLGTLDPYTVYIGKDEGTEVDLMTNGKYGGIGITIGLREGEVRVISVMEGYSAQRQGIVPGDRFLEIGGVKVTGLKPDEIRNLTRGDPGTEVKVVIERDGVPRPLDFVLIREEIQVKNVTYAGMVADSVGYVRLERFSRRAGDELRQAIKELKLNADVKGLVLDLRGNPGGLLDAAVDVVSKFVPRGSLVVNTRGRRAEADKKYYSTEEPLLGSMPLVVLTDRNSASASEIVAGSLQDLDRALIIGTRTFGKGLVQTIVPLNYGAQMKITTARYYIPSGRSIQEIDYIHRDRNGIFTVTPDSLRREFKTAHGRTVYELGGITPDSTVEPHDHGPMVKELIRKSLFFRFANRYVNEHKSESITGITPAILDAFRSYLEKEKFDFEEESEKDVAGLKKRAERSLYSKEVLDGIDRLAKSLEKEKERSFERYQKHLEEELLIELMARMHGDRGRIEASFKTDAQLMIAIDLVRNAKTYSRMLHG